MSAGCAQQTRTQKVGNARFYTLRERVLTNTTDASTQSQNERLKELKQSPLGTNGGHDQMKIGVIGGTGDQGLGIALRFVQAGEDVVIGSRAVEKAHQAVNKIKEFLETDEIPNLKAAENPDAAKEADILVLTVPLAAQSPTLLSIKEGAAGKILMDATGPLESAIGGSPTRCLYLPEGATAQRAQEILPDTTVVCAFNNISSGSLMNFKEPIDCDCLIAGDDQASKITVAKTDRANSRSASRRLRTTRESPDHRENHTAAHRAEHPKNLQRRRHSHNGHRPRVQTVLTKNPYCLAARV